jgi:hypothetical protein
MNPVLGGEKPATNRISCERKPVRNLHIIFFASGEFWWAGMAQSV